MTVPAAGPECDVCQAEPARVSLMDLTTYQNVRIGIACMPEFFATMAQDMAGVSPAPEPRPGEPATPVTAVLGPDGRDSGETIIGERVIDAAGQVVGHVDSDASVVYDPRPAAADVSRETGADPLGIGREAAQRQASEAQRQWLVNNGVEDPVSVTCPNCRAVGWIGRDSRQIGCPYCATLIDVPAAAEPVTDVAAADGPGAAAPAQSPGEAPF